MRTQFLRLLFLVTLLAVVFPSTTFGEPPQNSPSPRLGQKPNPDDEARIKLQKEMAKKANEERQLQLERDTDKLLKLSTELKEYVDKTNENVLSLEVLKKAEEIEKLAHSVKEKMKAY